MFKINIKKINLAVVGSGSISHRFIEACKDVEDVKLYAFCSRDIKKAQAFQDKYGFLKIYDDIDVLSQDRELDAVYIALPNSLHCEQTIKFLKNKKHVLCEKPFCTNSEEAKKMIKIAKENDVILMEAMRPTTLPNFLEVKNNLYKIGKIRRYFASFCKYSSRYDDFKNGIIQNAFKNELSNGALMDIGVYTLAPLINLFGKPKKIQSNAYMLHTNVDGNGSSILKYDDMEAVLIYSKIVNSDVLSEVQGEKGSIIIDGISTFKNVKILYNNGEEEKISVFQRENDMYYEIEEFARLILHSSKKEPLNSLKTTLDVMEILDEIRKNINLCYIADK